MSMAYRSIFLKTVALAALCFGAASLASAHTTRRSDFVCPINGERFTQQIDTSGTSFGAGLDFKPYGPIASPFHLPECPGNGFVLYRHDFSAEEIESLRTFVLADDFPRKAPQRYRVFAMQKHLGAPLANQFWSLVQTTWRSYGENGQYAREAVALASIIIAQEKPETKLWLNTVLLKGELERRLGQFEASAATFAMIAIDGEGDNKLAAGTVNIVNCQRELIARRSSSPSPIPGERTKCGDLMPMSY